MISIRSIFLGHLFGCERNPLHELFSFLLPSVERPVELHGMLCWMLLCDDRAHCGDGDVCGGQILRVYCERLHQLQRWLLSRQRRAVVLLDLFIGSCFSVLVPTQHHFDGFKESRSQAWVLLLCPV
jgi:hypothetical protein